jgi:hypothetical protein
VAAGFPAAYLFAMGNFLSARRSESGHPGARNWMPAFAGMSGMVLIVLSFIASAAAGVLDDSSYSIMKPEPNPPGVVNRYKSPHGTKKHVTVPKRAPDKPRHIPQMPPPIISPQTGQALPSLPPAIPGSGVGGRETGQDRAMRCAHQAGMYGQTAGPNYLGACINQ